MAERVHIFLCHDATYIFQIQNSHASMEAFFLLVYFSNIFYVGTTLGTLVNAGLSIFYGWQPRGVTTSGHRPYMSHEHVLHDR